MPEVIMLHVPFVVRMVSKIIKGNFSQDKFCDFFDLKVQDCSKYGMAREKKKTQSEKMQQQTPFFRRLFLPEFLREFSVRVFSL